MIRRLNNWLLASVVCFAGMASVPILLGAAGAWPVGWMVGVSAYVGYQISKGMK